MYGGRGAFRVLVLVAMLTAGAGIFTLLVTDIGTFEARTGFFSAAGTLIFDAIVLLVGLFAALGAASFFFPKSWGPKAGPWGAIVCALIAAFCFRVLWLGGA
ncbi:MAG TPA: hypothetical protein VIF14_01720 [Alphaproteobacteria bacterium]|jgi:hypothetical protein